jgi:SAM-dependent methyltransferase
MLEGPGRRRLAALVGGGALVAGAVRLNIRPVRDGFAALDRLAPGVRPAAQKLAWRGVYGMWNRTGAGPAFMNYGYAPLDGPVEIPDYGMALYDCVAGRADLTGKEVLEVGCGRGGGTSFIYDQRKPGRMVGVDLAKGSIDLARAEFERDGLSFLEGDAEHLPFEDASFDVVMNVESAHCYPDVPRFFDEVHRVLRPGGLFLIADVRFTTLERENSDAGPVTFEDVSAFRRNVAESAFRIVEEEDITANVKRALELDSPRRREVVERDVPKPFQSFAMMFAGVVGTALYQDFVDGNYTYLRYMLVKEQVPAELAGVGGDAALDGA